MIELSKVAGTNQLLHTVDKKCICVINNSGIYVYKVRTSNSVSNANIDKERRTLAHSQRCKFCKRFNFNKKKTIFILIKNIARTNKIFVELEKNH